ncbi:hypothetical protein HNQ91_003614 [Filimonas zeae]|uniref:YD repeat-containing protein n=1 Tax=Filimonas zeae TaxID=1737353 RepID=A0A917MX27_9BACT|nr:hypothetical protein [Filimonas zeae]MDR6340549.1 hypothetical protein [Filimonas zeae]GGH73257.1 hypothetical protein GCM10011379_34560 [Filimonas zeae]
MIRRVFGLFSLAAAILVSVLASAQTAPQLKVLTPPSPEVSALGKFGLIPVNNFSGVPSISYPVFTIEEGDISFPISLKYHASGIKVKEDASEVGLGWALSAGGTIISSERERPDFPAGFPTYAADMPDAPDATTSSRNPIASFGDHYYLWGGDLSIVGDSPEGLLYYGMTLPYKGVMRHYGNFFNIGDERPPDFASDLYMINIGERSYNFVFNNEFKPVVLGDGSLKIELITTNTGTYPDWKVTDEKGTIYYFTFRQFNYTNTGGNDPYYISNRTNQSLNTWHLTKIVSAVHGEINFNYDKPMQSFIHPLPSVSEVEWVAGTSSPNVPPSRRIITTNYSVYDQVNLSSISFSDGSIRFIYNNDRQDLDNSKRLTSIEIYNKSDELQRKVQLLNNAYFNSSSTAEAGYLSNSTFMFLPGYPAGVIDKRLKLNGITETDAVGGAVKTTRYAYNEQIQLPDKLSYSIDHWGYYNGAYNYRLTPPGTVNLNSQEISFEGANREANPNVMQSGILTSITHPTGGTTTFTYETNQFPFTELVTTYQDASQNYYKASGSAIMNSSGFMNADGSFTAASGWNDKKLYIFNMVSATVSYPSHYELSAVVYENNMVLKRIRIFTTNTSSIDSSIRLVGGRTYKVVLDPASQDFYNSLQIRMQVYIKQVSSTSSYVTRTRYSGGLRVNKISNYDPLSGKTNIKKYTYSGGNEDDLPIYISQAGTDHWMEMHNTEVAVYSNGFFKRFGQSIYPFSNGTNAPYFGYKNVTISESENNDLNGTTEYTYNATGNLNLNTIIAYSNVLPQTGMPNCIIPSIPSIGGGRGDLIEEKIFRKKEGGLKPVSSTFYIYNRDRTSRIWQFLFQMGYGPYLPAPRGARVYQMYAHQFSIPVYRNALTTKNSYLYDDDGNQIFNQYETYTYDKVNEHYQLIKKTTGDSKGNVVHSHIKYAQDYTNIADNPEDLTVAGIKQMQDKHVIEPVETYMEKVTPQGASRYYNGVLQVFYANKPLVKQIQFMEITAPLATFTPSIIQNDVFVKNTSYKERINFYYDNTNRLLRQSFAQGMPVSYIWGNHLKQPLAEVKNADYTQIWFEGFEESNFSGLVADAYTGRFAFNGSYQKTLTGVGDGKYILSYRLKSGGTWQLIQNEITVNNGSYTITLNGQIDDVRFYPYSAQMISYTLKPLTGITSVTDARSVPVYYEYDNFQRLKNIRDHNRQILKSAEYKYAQ